jgi:hypothetical protein
MLTRRTFLTMTVAVAVAGLAAAAVAGWSFHGHEGARVVQAHWKHRFESPSDLARGADAVVLARAAAVRPGRMAWSDNGEDSLPFEEIEFEVVRGVKGARGGDSIVVERAGGVDASGEVVRLDADGGPFEPGKTYLLFLKRQEEGSHFYQVSDQGRFAVEAGRLHAAAPDDDVAGFLHGRGVDDGFSLIAGWLRSDGGARGGRPEEPAE